MSKSAVTRWFVGAILAVIGGVCIGVAAIVGALAGGAVTFGGPDVVTVDDAFAGTLLWFLLASLLVIAGSLAAIVAWVGALLNTARLEDKTWFAVLLVLGLFSFGWIATAAYVLAGPDGIEPKVAYAGSATVPSS